ncbi:formate hydrogenlyase maturation protein [Citrobacter koseri]|uniref:Formate hydrogenlyase maturation protein n=1 Tax=Citrobacter koseri TaxID=545 RepID=A0A3S4I914_CITKO|nr:formate hydrogenlyase maturation protein [Citrobacter koseri]
MSETVVFSQLSRKFIDENDATPAEAQQVVYYSLAIGHHLGVIDCLEAGVNLPVGGLSGVDCNSGRGKRGQT